MTSKPCSSKPSHIKTHAGQTRGGIVGHVFRRLLHVSTVFIPLLYYYYGAVIAGWFSLTAKQIIIALLILNILFEILRITFQWTLPGHRFHEARTISSFAWSLLSIFIILLFAPGKEYAIPIIWTCALVDPLLGELRYFKVSTGLVVFLSLLSIMLIWWLCTGLFATPWWLAFIMAPVTAAAEWPNIKWLDDNALMQLLPFAVIMIIV